MYYLKDFWCWSYVLQNTVEGDSVGVKSGIFWYCCVYVGSFGILGGVFSSPKLCVSWV